MEAAKKRGHEITLFNRGRTEKQTGMIEGVEHLYGNRDPNLKSDDGAFQGMEVLKGKTWDAVLDTSGQYRRIVKASAELLAPGVKQYIFISSVSVYKNTDKVGADETDELHTLPPERRTPSRWARPTGASTTTARTRAACEKAAAETFPGRCAVVRPGLIVGPGDRTDRFTTRDLVLQKGGEVLAPGTPADPIQVIDVRDLGEWLVHVIENNITGEFDAVGPPPDLRWENCWMHVRKHRRATRRSRGPTPIFSMRRKVSAWGDMPVWVPPKGDSEGFHQRSIARGTKAGLKFRPILETVRDTLAWWPEELSVAPASPRS